METLSDRSKNNTSLLDLPEKIGGEDKRVQIAEPVGAKGKASRKHFLPCFMAALIGYAVIQTILYFVQPMTQRTSYLAATIEKHKLLASVKAPRIILLGGSNVAFGFDSPYIEKELGLPVINMGLHGGLGLRYALNEVQPHVQKGDLIVVSPEYPQFDDPDGDITLLQLLFVYPRGMQYLRPENIASFPRSFLQMMQFKRNWWAKLGVTAPTYDRVYNRFALNEKGDVVSHLNAGIASHKYFPAQSQLLNRTKNGCPTIRAIDDFARSCTSRGATVFYSYPAVVSDYFLQPENFNNIYRLDRQLREDTNITVTGRPDRYAFSSTDFFDTINHLTGVPRRVRSQRLVEDLIANPVARRLVHPPERNIAPQGPQAPAEGI